MRIATVDIGTNSANLLISEMDPRNVLKSLKEEWRTIRLGEGVDANGTLSETAIQRLLTTLKEFRSIAELWEVEQLVVVGTSASRDTGNRIVQIVKTHTGLDYEILSGDKEADLSFEGAISGLSRPHDRMITCDVGGGSTELVEGTADGSILQRHSVNIGSVRLTERYFSSQPPSQDELNLATRFVRKSLAELSFSDSRSTVLVGASDAHRLLIDLQRIVVENPQMVDSFNSSWRQLRQIGVHSDLLFLDQLRGWLQCLSHMTTQNILNLAPEMLNGRADVFPAAVLIFLEVMNKLGHESMTVSKWGLCHGVALRILQTGTLK